MSPLTRRELGRLACGLVGGLALPAAAAAGVQPREPADALLPLARELLAAARVAWQDSASARPTPPSGDGDRRVPLAGGGLWIRRWSDLWRLAFDLPAGTLVLAGDAQRLLRITAQPATPQPGPGFDTLLLDGEAARLTHSGELARRGRRPLELPGARVPSGYERFARAVLAAGRSG